MRRKLLALSLVFNVLLLASVGLLEHRVLMHDARVFWHDLMGTSGTPSVVVPMASSRSSPTAR